MNSCSSCPRALVSDLSCSCFAVPARNGTGPDASVQTLSPLRPGPAKASCVRLTDSLLLRSGEGTQDLVLEIGRLSAISTTSPSLYSPFSSWAWYLLDAPTILPYSSCGTSSTSTVMVLARLSLTTLPTRVRCSSLVGLGFAHFAASFFFSARMVLARAMSRRSCPAASGCSAAGWPSACAGRSGLQPILRGRTSFLGAGDVLGAQFRCFHEVLQFLRRRSRERRTCTSAAAAEASVKASRPAPRHALIRTAPCPAGSRPPSTPGCPCRCPMRTSAGFCEIGLSGKMRMKMAAALDVARDGATRPRSGAPSGDRARWPSGQKSPKDTAAPRVAMPCCSPSAHAVLSAIGLQHLLFSLPSARRATLAHALDGLGHRRPSAGLSLPPGAPD